MKTVRVWLIDVAIALPICFVGAALLGPRIGFWRSFLIITLTSMLVTMYIEQRWPRRGSKP